MHTICYGLDWTLEYWSNMIHMESKASKENLDISFLSWDNDMIYSSSLEDFSNLLMLKSRLATIKLFRMT